MDKTEILSMIKERLQEAYLLSKEYAKEIGNTQMHIHIASIGNKWLGGIGTDGVAPQQQKRTSTVAPYVPSKEDFEKKPDIKKRQPAKLVDDLSKKTLSELKLIARDMGLEFKGRDAKGLLEIINMTKKRIKDEDEVEVVEEQIADQTDETEVEIPDSYKE